MPLLLRKGSAARRLTKPKLLWSRLHLLFNRRLRWSIHSQSQQIRALHLRSRSRFNSWPSLRLDSGASLRLNNRPSLWPVLWHRLRLCKKTSINSATRPIRRSLTLHKVTKIVVVIGPWLHHRRLRGHYSTRRRMRIKERQIISRKSIAHGCSTPFSMLKQPRGAIIHKPKCPGLCIELCIARLLHHTAENRDSAVPLPHSSSRGPGQSSELRLTLTPYTINARTPAKGARSSCMGHCTPFLAIPIIERVHRQARRVPRP